MPVAVKMGRRKIRTAAFHFLSALWLLDPVSKNKTKQKKQITGASYNFKMQMVTSNKTWQNTRD